MVSIHSAGFHRRINWKCVTPSNPCPICKHGSWCSVTEDGVLCACRRSGELGGGIKKTDKNGQDYWLHRLIESRNGNGEKWEEPRHHHTERNREQGSLEILDRVYRALIHCSYLSPAHRNDLDRRGLRTGFKDRGYFTLGKGRAKMAYALVRAGLEQYMPLVPGLFVQEKDGKHYWSISGLGGLGIPIRNVQRRIVAVQVRADEPQEGGKYKFLSTKKRGGAGPGAPIHVPLFDGDTTIVRVTEGALKADIATDRSEILTIGLPGVSAWRRAAAVLRELGAKTVRVAYDADACRNRVVAECLSHLVNHLRQRGYAVELELWDEADGKGIDDLLAADKVPDVVTGDEIVDSAISRIVADARKADPPPGTSQENGQVVNGHHLTDLGNGERLAKHHGANLRHCHPWKRWLHWSGQRWEEDQTGAIYARAIETVRRIYVEAAECEDAKMRAALAEHANNSEAAKSIRAMIDLGRALPGIPIMPAEMDTDTWLFNVRNGTLDLRSGKLREYNRSDHITKLCPIEYHPDAVCPTWERFLGAIFPDDEDEPDMELITFMQRWLGRCLTGDVSEQNLPIFWGCGANGKSTLVNAVLDTLGSDYSMKANADLLMTSRSERHPTELASLFGMRLVVASETHQGRHLNETLVKDLTGGEPIRARRMREDFWEFKPTYKIVLLTNHKPRVAGTDEGIWRRLRLVPFTTTFWDPADPGKNPDQLPSNLRQDKQLSQKLAAEREGILAWLVRGCMDWQRDGLTLPAKVRVATTDYRQSEDLIAQWLEECCITGSHDFRCRAADLFSNYRAWCERAGEEDIMNQKSFGDSLSERGFERQKSRGVIWRLGVALSQAGRGDDGDDLDEVSG
jgi:P4 family phage/plasmid primase-like protien